MLKNLKIFPKIFISCLLIVLVPLVGFFYQVYLNASEHKAIVEQRLLQTSEIIAGEVNGWMDKNVRSSDFLSSVDAFKTMDAKAQQPLLVAAKNNLEWASLIFVTDINGNAVSRSDGKTLKNYSDREYFKQVKSGQPMGQQVLIGKLKPIPLHCFAIPIKNDDRLMVGVITQCSSLLSISNYIFETTIGSTGYAFLVDEKNNVIANGGIKAVASLTEGLQSFSGHPALKLKSNKVTSLSYKGTDKVFVKRSVGSGWTLVVQQDYTEAYENYLNAEWNAKILSAATLIMTLLLSFLISYSIFSPIKQLTQAADAFSKGLFTQSVTGEDRKDELGDLARAVARMAKTIQIALTRLRKKK
ncbi:MAG: methyl-accepting chemotaxis protein [Candidatus Endobugula sp.]|jgi:methyl-accepting chemotaxis protein